MFRMNGLIHVNDTCTAKDHRANGFTYRRVSPKRLKEDLATRQIAYITSMKRRERYGYGGHLPDTISYPALLPCEGQIDLLRFHVHQ